jgi:hypothetical protein
MAFLAWFGMDSRGNKRVQSGCGLKYLVDTENAVVADVETTPARTYEEVEATKATLDWIERRLNLTRKRLAADIAMERPEAGSVPALCDYVRE